MADTPFDPYEAERQNLGPLRFMNSVPFGPQMAAAAQAAGARFRGDATDFGTSYDYHRRQNDAALQALAAEKSGIGWEAASQIPYVVSGPAGAAAYAATSSATRGEPIHEAAMQAALMGAPTAGPSGPVNVGPMMAAPIKFPNGREKPFPEFEDVKKGFRIPGGSVHETGPFHDVTKLPEPYNDPNLADFVDDGFILTGMKAPIQQKGFDVTGGHKLPDHFVKRADFNNPDKTRPEAWGLPDWSHLTGMDRSARGTGRNEEMAGYKEPPWQPPGKVIGDIQPSVFAGEPGWEGDTPSAMGQHFNSGKMFTVPDKSSPLNELINALTGNDPAKVKAAKEAIESVISENPLMTSADDPNAWFNRRLGTNHPLLDQPFAQRVNKLKAFGPSANEPMKP